MSAFKMKIDGVTYWNSVLDLLMQPADIAYGPADQVSIEERGHARETVLRILSAARAKGFKSGEILETLLARGERSDRVIDLACDALNVVGSTGDIEAVVFGSGFGTRGAH